MKRTQIIARIALSNALTVPAGVFYVKGNDAAAIGFFLAGFIMWGACSLVVQKHELIAMNEAQKREIKRLRNLLYLDQNRL